MRIHLTLKPYLKVMDDPADVGSHFLKVNEATVSGREPPPTSFVLREWDVHAGRRHESEAYEMRLFMGEIRERFRAFTAVVEWQGAPAVMVTHAFHEILCWHRFKGDFSGHPVLCGLDPNATPPPGPIPEDGHRFDLIHRPRTGRLSWHYTVALSMAEIEQVKKRSPISGVTTKAWLPLDTTMLGMNGLDLPREVFWREGIGNYLLRTFDLVKPGGLTWKDLYKPVSLSDDALGIH